jgi:hypothetical protein
MLAIIHITQPVYEFLSTQTTPPMVSLLPLNFVRLCMITSAPKWLVIWTKVKMYCPLITEDCIF